VSCLYLVGFTYRAGATHESPSQAEGHLSSEAAQVGTQLGVTRLSSLSHRQRARPCHMRCTPRKGFKTADTLLSWTNTYVTLLNLFPQSKAESFANITLHRA
jgi:hypothetical protein